MTAIRKSTIQKTKFQHVTSSTTDYCASNDRFGFIPSLCLSDFSGSRIWGRTKRKLSVDKYTEKVSRFQDFF